MRADKVGNCFTRLPTYYDDGSRRVQFHKMVRIVVVSVQKDNCSCEIAFRRLIYVYRIRVYIPKILCFNIIFFNLSRTYINA